MASKREKEVAQSGKLADEVAKRVISSMNEPEVDNFDDLTPESETEYGEQLADTVGFDIFDYGDQRQKQGDQVLYVIKKNGEMLTSRYHPYSWEKLQGEFGAGSYQIVAKSLITKKYLKSETRPVAEPQGTHFKFGNEEPKQQIAQAPGFMEIFSLMNNASEKSRLEAREMSKDQAQNSNAMLQGFVTMMQTMSNQSQTMFMEMAKLNQNVAEKMTENTNKMFEKMDERFQKIIEKIGHKKDDEFGAMALIKLTEDSQKKGFDMFDKISKLAEMKAEEKIQLLEENRPEKTGKKSMVDTLIESVLPSVTQALQAAQPQAQRPQQPRRYLPQQPRPYAPQATGPGQRNQNPGNPTVGQVETAQGQASGENSRGASRNNNESGNALKNQFGLPTMKVEPLEIKTKEAIEEILVPVMGASLLALDNIKAGADKIKNTLQENGIPVKLFIESFKKEDAVGLATKYSLPPEAATWFEGVYADIENSAGVDAR